MEEDYVIERLKTRTTLRALLLLDRTRHILRVVLRPFSLLVEFMYTRPSKFR